MVDVLDTIVVAYRIRGSKEINLPKAGKGLFGNENVRFETL